MQLVILRDNTTATGSMSLGETGDNQQHQKLENNHRNTRIYRTQVSTNKALFDSTTIYPTIHQDAWLLHLCSTVTLPLFMGLGSAVQQHKQSGNSDVLDYRQWQQGLLLELHPRYILLLHSTPSPHWSTLFGRRHILLGQQIHCMAILYTSLLQLVYTS